MILLCLLISLFFIFIKSAAKSFVEVVVEDITAGAAVMVEVVVEVAVVVVEVVVVEEDFLHRYLFV